MTGRLHLRLDKYLMGDPVDRAAVASILALPPVGTTGQGSMTRQEVVIPSGASPPMRVDLDPGLYLVEATLPSGDLVSDEVEIFDDKDSTLELRPDESPHEWLSWQQFMGNVERKQRYFSDSVRFAPLVPIVYWVAEPVSPLRGEGASAGDAWTLLAELSSLPGDAANRLSAGPPGPVGPWRFESLAWLYQVTADGPWNQEEPPTTGRSRQPTPRQYLIVENAGASHLVCLPVPWTSLVTVAETQLPVQVLVRKPTAENAPTITVTIRDRQLGPALGYMALGDLPTAERLFNQARHTVSGQQTNTLGAVGAGYVLLGTERSSEPKEWHSWINNLNSFDWIPDAAIQHGWLKLRHRRSSADLDEAREALFTAYRRGLPFYSVGLRWLMDGLTLFAPHDPDADAMLQIVRRVAWRTSLREPFTIVRLPLP